MQAYAAEQQINYEVSSNQSANAGLSFKKNCNIGKRSKYFFMENVSIGRLSPAFSHQSCICIYVLSIDIVTLYQTIIFTFYIHLNKLLVIELQKHQRQQNRGSQCFYVNLCMRSHLSHAVVPRINSEALLLISEQTNVVYSKI